MLDGDATTGTPRSAGAELNPKRMTAKERSALKKKIASQISTKGVSTTSVMAAAENAVQEIEAGANSADALVAAAEKTAADAEAALQAAEAQVDAAKAGEATAKVQEELDRLAAEAKAAAAATQAKLDQLAADAKAAAEATAKAQAEAEAKAKTAAEAAAKAAAEAEAKAKAAEEAAKKAAAEAEAKAKAAQEAADKAAAEAAEKAKAATAAAADEATKKANAAAKAAADEAAAKAAAEAKAAQEAYEAALKAARDAQAKAEADAKAAAATADAVKASANINVTGSTPLTVPGPFETVISPANAADIAAAKLAEANAKAAKEEARQSVITTLSERFSRYGLQSLVPKIKDLAVIGASEATVSLQLQETEEYKQRFGANQARIKAGLAALSPGEYLAAEDGYRQILRAYGLNNFATDQYVQQFIENDVSASELSNRVATAVQRVQNADPAVLQTLKDYYGIGEADAVAYILDPAQQITKIQRQVSAAEIGAAARIQGIQPGVGVAEQLAAQGISQAEARKGYATIADILPTAEKLSQIYGEVETTYGLAEAEQEVFNQLASAQRRREQLMKREMAQFSGQSGLGRTSLTSMDRGQF